MRATDEQSGSLFSYVDLEGRIRRDHPLRAIREIANAALSDLSKDFDGLFTNFGRAGIAPEKLLQAMLLQAFCGVRSERQVFGWIKSSAGLAKAKLRGRARVDAAFTLALAAYNLIRLPRLLGAAA